MKKIDGYPHNGYPTDMGTGTGRIFIQRIGYGGATTRTLPAPLTSLVVDQVSKCYRCECASCSLYEYVQIDCPPQYLATSLVVMGR